MGTKLNPGKFDAYDKALPDEPMFTLLARDPGAPGAIHEWMRLRDRVIPLPNEKINEASACMEAMKDWRTPKNLERVEASKVSAERPTVHNTATSPEFERLCRALNFPLDANVPDVLKIAALRFEALTTTAVHIDGSEKDASYFFDLSNAEFTIQLDKLASGTSGELVGILQSAAWRIECLSKPLPLYDYAEPNPGRGEPGTRSFTKKDAP